MRRSVDATAATAATLPSWAGDKVCTVLCHLLKHCVGKTAIVKAGQVLVKVRLRAPDGISVAGWPMATAHGV